MLAGFPAGTVSGAPKIRAMEIIDELETTKRKVYAGSIGYFSANGEFDTCIALRTAVAKNNKFFIKIFVPIIICFIIIRCSPTNIILNLKNFYC